MAYSQYRKKVYKPVERPDPDKVLTEDEVKKMKDQARKLCFYYLGKSDKTRKDLFDRLKQKYIRVDIIQEVLDYFEEKDYINDQRFAVNFVSYNNKVLGKNALRSKLYLRGVASEYIDEALEDFDTDFEYEQVRKLAESRLNSTRKLERRKRFEKIYGYLVRRGFSSSVVSEVLKEVLNADDEEYGDEAY